MCPISTVGNRVYDLIHREILWLRPNGLAFSRRKRWYNLQKTNDRARAAVGCNAGLGGRARLDTAFQSLKRTALRHCTTLGFGRAPRRVAPQAKPFGCAVGAPASVRFRDAEQLLGLVAREWFASARRHRPLWRAESSGALRETRPSHIIRPALEWRPWIGCSIATGTRMIDRTLAKRDSGMLTAMQGVKRDGHPDDR